MVAFAFRLLFFLVSLALTQKRNNNTGLLRQLSRKVVQVEGMKLRSLLFVRISVIEIEDRNSCDKDCSLCCTSPLQPYNVWTQHLDI